MSVYVVGISAFYHDSSCCIIKDGLLIAAAQEERFTRIKADSALPKNAFKYCLKEANINVADIACLAYYENPVDKFSRQIWSGLFKTREHLNKHIPNNIEEALRKIFGYEGPIRFMNHHLSHAASAFYFSGFENSAILTMDGVGEWATTSYGFGKGNEIKIFEEVLFPHSLGLFYSTITKYLGFGVNDGEYKVMGLAPYGKPLYVKELKTILNYGVDGQYELNLEFFDFIAGEKMFSDLLPELLGRPPREENSELLQFHSDIAKSLQVVLEEILIEKANYLFSKSNCENLCMAGGVALNCVANGKILKNTPFKRLFVQPAANDAGCALGAAAMAYIEITGEKIKRLQDVYNGPAFSHNDIAKTIAATSINSINYMNDLPGLIKLTAKKLAEGKVIGWFQGRMEFGPRALGSRSIIADPRNAQMRDRINGMVKKRESFRPFAPAVLAHRANEFFELDHPSPYMLETCEVRDPLSFPAITHLDNSARVQTVDEKSNLLFAMLLKEFDLITKCPILLNTSFNVKGEPIVCTPEDAIKCFIKTDIDCLVVGNFFIDRSENDFEIIRMILDFDENRKSVISQDVYTFI